MIPVRLRNGHSSVLEHFTADQEVAGLKFPPYITLDGRLNSCVLIIILINLLSSISLKGYQGTAEFS